MDVTSLQEALPVPDLPASLDGYVPSASHGMISWTASINDYLSSVHIKATNNLCKFRWATLPCRACPQTPRCGSALLPASVQSITHYSGYSMSSALLIQKHTCWHCIEYIDRKSFYIESGDREWSCCLSSMNLELGNYNGGVFRIIKVSAGAWIVWILCPLHVL
jgi:hypothetical protein